MQVNEVWISSIFRHHFLVLRVVMAVRKGEVMLTIGGKVNLRQTWPKIVRLFYLLLYLVLF